MLAHPIKKQRLVSKARAGLCSPGYARELVARIRLHVAKNATVFPQWPVFGFPNKPAQVRTVFWRLLRPAMPAHQIMTNRSGFAPSGIVVLSHEVKKWIRT